MLRISVAHFNVNGYVIGNGNVIIHTVLSRVLDKL